MSCKRYYNKKYIAIFKSFLTIIKKSKTIQIIFKMTTTAGLSTRF